MSLNPYIDFNGNCRDAVLFYKDVFNAEEPIIMTYEQGHSGEGEELPENIKDLVMHTSLVIGGVIVMFSDITPDMPYIVGNNVSLTLVTNDMEEIKQVYNKLAEDGKVGMELQETFWSKLYGSVTDKFGIIWQLSHEE